MAYFKKGDRVVGLVGDNHHEKGDHGTVDQNNSTCPYVVWDKTGRHPEYTERLKLLVENGANFKIGDAVVIVARDSGNQYGCMDWDKPDGDVGKNGTIDQIDDELDRPYCVKNKKNAYAHEYIGWFAAHEISLLNQGSSKKMAKRTFKLIKEAPGMHKGALLQEECEDGTQPYSIINGDTHSKDPSFNISFAKRELVENAPEFFVEVFKIMPDYMTKEELEQFEQFKKSNKPAKVPKKRGRPVGSKTKKRSRNV